MQNNEIKKHASKICAEIIHTRSHLLGEKLLEDFSEEELKSLVDEEFRRCGLNLFLVGSLSDLGKTSILLQLETKATLHSLDEVKELLKIQVEKYISDLSLSIKTNKSEKKRRIHFKSEMGVVPAGIASDTPLCMLKKKLPDE